MKAILCRFSTLPFISAVVAASVTCDFPIPLSQTQFDIPSWQSSNYSCLGTPQVYTVRPSPGKGLGVFATHTLEPGDIVMQEEPLIKIRPPEFRDGMGYPLNQIGILVREAFENLSADMQADVLSLHAHLTAAEKNNPNLDKLRPIFRSNAYTTGKDIGLFPKIARINHSCRPNTSYFWNERLNKRVVYATRRIEEGEEFSVTYIPLLFTHAERQKRLDQYGFECSCEACSADTAFVETSDRRRKDIQRAFWELENKLTLDVPKTVTAKKKARSVANKSADLVRLVEEEELADYYAPAYRVAAISHARLQDWEPATIWAHKSYQLRLMADAQSKETKEMEVLTNNFISSWNNALSNKEAGKG